MRVAGVKLRRGRTVWSDASNLELSPGAHVTVQGGESEEDGVVLVAPEQIIQGPEDVEGVVTAVHPDINAVDSCDDIPGAQMPPLGSAVRIDVGEGMVIGLDPVGGTVVVQFEDEQYTMPLADIRSFPSPPPGDEQSAR
jgi:hypothetical protein